MKQTLFSLSVQENTEVILTLTLNVKRMPDEECRKEAAIKI